VGLITATHELELLLRVSAALPGCVWVGKGSFVTAGDTILVLAMEEAMVSRSPRSDAAASSTMAEQRHDSSWGEM